MAFSFKWGSLALGVSLAGLQVSCITGHALDGARLDESPVTILEACRQGDWVRVRYDAVTTREFGDVVSRDERAAEINLAQLKAWPRVQVDTIKVNRMDPKKVKSGEPCTAIPVRLGTPEAPGGKQTAIAIPHGALHRDRTAPWAYPLVPVTLALDAVATPVLVFIWVPYAAISD